MAKAKDINVYKIFSKTFNDRPMFSFMGYGELKLMPKVAKPILQTKPKISLASNVEKFIKEKKEYQLRMVVNNDKK